MSTPDRSLAEEMPSPAPPSGSVPAPNPARRAPRDFAAEELLSRRLTGITIQIRRAEFIEAEAEITAILAENPGYAPALELKGDVRQSLGDHVGATAAWRESLQQEPGRPTAEMKLARAALEHAEDQRRQQFGMAYAGSDTTLVRSTNSGEQKKNVTFAVIGSAAVPGLGQFINGENVKGAITAVAYFFGLLILAFLPETKALFRQLTALLNPMDTRHHFAVAPSPFAWLLLAITTGIWVYSMVDAALVAGHSEPVAEVGKSGWEV